MKRDELYIDLARVALDHKGLLIVYSKLVDEHFVQTVNKLGLKIIDSKTKHSDNKVIVREGHVVEEFLLGDKDKLIIERSRIGDYEEACSLLRVRIKIEKKADCNGHHHMTKIPPYKSECKEGEI